MSVRNRILAGVAGLALSIGMALPASGESLADALAAAYRNSNLLEQNRALLRAADEDVQQAVADLLPVVNFISSASTSDTRYDLSTSLSLEASLTLLDFGRGRLSVAATREGVMATRAALVSIEQNVLLNAVTAYMTLYSDLQAVSLQRNNVTVITQQLRAARERFELGDSTRTDVALAEARLAASRSALALAQGNVAIDREVYNLAVGAYPSSLDSPPSLPRLPASLEAAQEIARQNHPSITQVQHLVAAEDMTTDIIRRQRYGTVTGSASATYSDTTGSPRGANDGSTSDISASVRYSVPLYSGGALSSAERQQVARAQSQRSNLHQTMATVRQSVAASWAQLQIARASVVASDQQISATQSAYDAVRAEAELGSRTTLDVLDAEQELLDARSSRIAAAANVQLAAYSLLASMGQLTVEALNLGIPTYDVEAYGAGLRHAPAPATRSRQGDALDRIMGRYNR
ncbi:TolC family outer membrane protein [Cereibacter sphaeroides]|nr:TolC family outer membrane protein [Cereibacter sphaeroides]